jgi:hypothetical protein
MAGGIVNKAVEGEPFPPAKPMKNSGASADRRSDEVWTHMRLLNYEVEKSQRKKRKTRHFASKKNHGVSQRKEE